MHGKLTVSDSCILRIAKTKHPLGFMQKKYRDKQYEVLLADRSFEFLINRFRLLETESLPLILSTTLG